MDETAAAELRSERRTNMFVMARIAAATGGGPVKVRNVSPGGALVEGAVLPCRGTAFQLHRANASISGCVVWSGGGRAGLRFDSICEVSEWLPQSRNGQQRVDELVHHIKTAAPSAPTPPLPVNASEQPTKIAGELRRIKEALESLADELADDPAVVERHSAKLQTLDIAAQALGALAGPSRHGG